MAAVVAATQAIAQLGLRVRVTTFAALAQNMRGGGFGNQKRVFGHEWRVFVHPCPNTRSKVAFRRKAPGCGGYFQPSSFATATRLANRCAL